MILALLLCGLTLQETIELALKNSPEHRDARRAWEAAQARYSIGRAERGFVIEYRGSADHDFDEDQNLRLTLDVPGFETEKSRFTTTHNRVVVERALPTGGDVEFGVGVRTTDFESTRSRARNSTRSLLSLGLDQPVFRANPHTLDARREEADLSIAEATYRESRLDITDEAVDRYVAWMTTVEESGVRRLALLDAERAESVARAEVEAGDRLPTDQFEAELAVRDAEIAIRENAIEILRAEARLRELIAVDLSPASDIILDIARPELPDNFENHPRIIRLRMELERVEISLRKIQAERGAQFDLTGDYSLEGDRELGLFADFTRAWSAGATVTVPFYNGGARRKEIALAGEDVIAAREELDLERARIAREAREARLEIDAALARAEIATDRIGQAEKEVRLEEVRYSVGEATMRDVREAQTRLVEARIAAVRARGDAIRAELKYKGLVE